MNGSAGTGTKDPQLDLFYNTTHLSSVELRIRRQNANFQSTRILKFFDDNPNGLFTPFEVRQYAGLGHIPITSIRRALNTLTAAGLLIKTRKMRSGDYGALNHTWKKAI